MAKEMLGNFFAGNNLDEKMQTLRSKIERLSCRAADVNAELEDAESRSGKKRKREVENWLMNVERNKNEVERLEQDVSQDKFVLRSQLGKRADKVNGEVAELIEQGRFPEGLLLDVSETEEEPLLTTKLIGQVFRKNMEKIWACLMKDEVLIVGIYGMGGAGKTTLVMHIYNQLLEKSKPFDHVYWITVSQEFNIHKLQDGIAKMVNLDFSNEDDGMKRAAKLSKALSRKEKCVLILDDMWTHFSLEQVGIPVRVNGCKLILTTRSLDVCRRMGCKENIIKVEPLSKEEAWNLFREKLGHHTALSPQVQIMAMSVANKCSGLPLGIIVMAGSMRGVNNIHEWRNVLEELNELTTGQRDMEAEVFPILKFSYHRLKDTTLQRCFLYCAMYPEDDKIRRHELINKFIAEGLIEKRKSRRAEFDMGHTLLNKLENACLLERCEHSDGDGWGVKMHDLMRAMALDITRVSPRFMVRAGVQLREIPEEKEWTEDLEKVSLMENYIEEIPQCRSPRCPRLSTLMLRGNPLRGIPDYFFMQMPALRVLDLSDTQIINLPNSISDLENLTALWLRGCSSLEYVPSLGKLRALQFLDLSDTGIREVPQGMDMLVNLKCLYMEDTENLQMLPSGILPRLSHLQVLRLDIPLGNVIRGEELDEFKQLEEFSGRLYNEGDLNRFVKSHCDDGGMNFYRLQVGDHINDEEYYYDKEVKLGNCSLNRGGGDCLLRLPHDIQSLTIEKSDGRLCDVSSSLKYARDLKFCQIWESDGIDCILSLSDEESRCVPLLQSLEYLHVERVWNLSALIKWGGRDGVIAPPPPSGTFSSLKELSISQCPKIKKLFMPGLQLSNLEFIDVDGCYQMEEIIADDEEGMGASTSSSICTNLPKLTTLSLSWLPELKSICRGLMSCDSIRRIKVVECRKLNRLPFPLPLVNEQPSPPQKLQEIVVHDLEWWESLQWDHPNAKNVLQTLVKISRY